MAIVFPTLIAVLRVASKMGSGKSPKFRTRRPGPRLAFRASGLRFGIQSLRHGSGLMLCVYGSCFEGCHKAYSSDI